MNNLDRIMVRLRNLPYELAEQAAQNLTPRHLKLMNFPKNVFRKIVILMEVFDVFSLTLVSKKTRTQVMLVDIQMDCLEIIHDSSHHKIIFRNHWQEPVLQFNFDCKLERPICKLVLDKYKLFVIAKRFVTKEYLCYSHQFEEDLPFLLNYFSSVFRFRSGFVSVSLNKRTAKLRKLIDHPIFNERLVLKLSGKLKAGYRNLETLLHKYDHLEGLFICFTFDRRDFDHKEILNLKRVCFVEGHWMKREDLLNSEFQRLKLLSHSLNSDDINAFIKQWLAGNNKKLRRLELVCQTLSKVQVMRGLDCMLWEKQLRHQYYLIDHIQSPYLVDTRQGFDVLRKDGLLATILIKDKSFLFCVWHTRFYSQAVQNYPMRPMKLLNNL